MCTNIESAVFAKDIEAENGILVIDSVFAALWNSLQLAETDPSCIDGWGGISKYDFTEYPEF